MLWSVSSILLKKNQTELRVKLINMSAIRFVSGDNYENLRGETLHGAIIDEMREQHRDLWPMVIRPMLATTRGWAAFVSTPSGFDSFYELFKKGESGRDPNWGSIQAPSTANPHFTQEEFEAARADMSEEQFAQEILAEFRELGVGKVYVSHGAHNQRINHPFAIRGQKISPHLPIVVGLDFNVGKMCWVLGQFKGQAVHWHDELVIRNTNTQEAAPALIPKLQGHKPGVILIGDASGKARRSSASATDYQIILETLRAAGISVKNLTPEANPPVKDRVNVVNSALRAADGSINFTYNPETCPELRLDLERTIWKQGAEGAVIDKSDPERTHASDAAGYPVAYYSTQLRPKPGKLYVIEHAYL